MLSAFAWFTQLLRATALFLIASGAVAAAAGTVEIKGKVTNQLTEPQYKAVAVIVTDRLGVELGRTHPDKRGQYVLKITAPRYIIIKAQSEGFPEVLYQLDTQEIRESTSDREENRVFGDMRIPTYFQNITFSANQAPAGMEDLLAGVDPSAVKAYQAARAQKEAGDLAKSIASLDKVVRDYPTFYLAAIELGMSLAAQQEHDRALEVFKRAQALRPDHAWGYVGLGLVLNARKDFAAAVPHLSKAVELEPDSVQAQFQLGHAAFQTGDHDRALASLTRSVQLEPKFNPMAQKLLAAIYTKKQDPGNAAKALESYLEHFPAAPDAERVRQILARLKG